MLAASTGRKRPRIVKLVYAKLILNQGSLNSWPGSDVQWQRVHEDYCGLLLNRTGTILVQIALDVLDP